jgi:ankyrin repeat protein
MKKIIDTFYNNQKEFGTKESNAIFFNAMFTSWVSPCTVWTNTFMEKSKFLMLSSSITLSVHLLNLINLFLISDLDMLSSIENPPILHCFNSYKYFNNISYNYYYSKNFTTIMINICKNNEECLPQIRICSEDEMSNTLMYTFIIPIGILFFSISFFASLCLQILSNYTKMYAFQKAFFLACPKSFFWLVIDFVYNYNKVDEILRKQVLKKLEKEVTKNVVSQNSLKKLLSPYRVYFERSEETKRLYSKVEEISKEDENASREIAKDISQVVWQLSPMHAAVDSNKFGLWCFMYVLGGEAGALNGQQTSSIKLLLEKSENDFKLLGSCNFVSRHLIKTASEMYGEYALHKAIKLGDIQLLKILINNGYDIEESDNNNQKPLLLALAYQKLDCLELLLQHEARVHDKDLDLAASFHCFDCLKILLEANMSNTNLIESRNTLLIWAAFDGNLPLLKFLIDNNADINTNNEEGQTPLHMSAMKGHLDCVKHLIDNKADVDAKDQNCQTPLYLSAWSGHLQCIKYLIDNKADINAKNIEDQTPLYISAWRGHLECCKYLFDNYADVSVKGQTLLHIHAWRGDLEFCKYLIDHKVDVNGKDEEDQTPLHICSTMGNLTFCKYLFDHKADVNLKDKYGQTPLHKSSKEGHLKCIKYLIDNKADVNSKDTEGQTPLHFSALKGHPECCQYLIENNADVNVTDLKHNTPLHIVGEYVWSEHKNTIESAEFLIRAGADLNASNEYGFNPMENEAVQKLKRMKPELFSKDLEKQNE